MKTFLQGIRKTFSRELARHLAARLGERERAVGRALQGMVPMVLCQLVIKTGAGEGRQLFPSGLQLSWPKARGVQNITEVLALLGGGSTNSYEIDAGEILLGRLFGANRPALDNLLTAYSGLRPASAGLLLRLVGAVVAVGLAHFVAQQQLNAQRLSEELANAKNQVYAWLPADLPPWPGYQRRTAVKAPHSVWAAELSRPYWVLVLAAAGAVVLALLVLGTSFSSTNRHQSALGMPSAHLDLSR